MDYILLLFFVLTPMLVIATASGFIITFKAMLSDTNAYISKNNRDELLNKSFMPAFLIIIINSTIIIVHAMFFNDFTDDQMPIWQAAVISHSIALVGLFAVYFYIRSLIHSKRDNNVSDNGKNCS